MCLEIEKTTDNMIICKFKGTLDTQISKDLENSILEQINSCKDVCSIEFDMKEVDYVASFFIRICVSIKRHNRVDAFFIKNVCNDVYKIFKVLDLVKTLNVSQA